VRFFRGVPVPPVRVANTILWPDGRCRRMTLRERFQWRFQERRLFRP